MQSIFVLGKYPNNFRILLHVRYGLDKNENSYCSEGCKPVAYKRGCKLKLYKVYKLKYKIIQNINYYIFN